MQSEYPLSVLIVVPPWPGPVEQNPEPTTPTGPPRPAAAAAATLSRYQGYIERSAEYRNVFLPDLLSAETWRVASSKADISHSRSPSRSCILSLSRFLFSLFPVTSPRYGHDTRGATYTSPPMISLHRGPRAVSSRYTPRSRSRTTTTTLSASVDRAPANGYH